MRDAAPALGRLAHIRAVLAVRPSLQVEDAYRASCGWWRSERNIRAARSAPLHRVVYLTSQTARGVVDRAAALVRSGR